MDDQGTFGIIFDARMPKHEVGLDIDSISEAPEPLSRKPFIWPWLGPTLSSLRGLTFRQVPVAVISAAGSYTDGLGQAAKPSLPCPPPRKSHSSSSKRSSSMKAGRNSVTRFPQSATNSRNILIGRSWNGFACKLPFSLNQPASAAIGSRGA